jgi:hypothetical protein
MFNLGTRIKKDPIGLSGLNAVTHVTYIPVLGKNHE